MTVRILIPIVALAAAGLSACATKAPPATAPGPVAAAESPQAIPNPQTGAPAAIVRTLQEELAANAGDRVFFGFDSHALSDDARATLGRQAVWLAGNPQVRVIVAGNADERGTREYNLALGDRRAAAARRYLSTQGVDLLRMDTVSYGKERPLDPGVGEEAWARNRNAQTIVAEGAGAR